MHIVAILVYQRMEDRVAIYTVMDSMQSLVVILDMYLLVYL